MAGTREPQEAQGEGDYGGVELPLPPQVSAPSYPNWVQSSTRGLWRQQLPQASAPA